jgi:protein-L-isoaspartate(D-aspartate) O-methyltransferase
VGDSKQYARARRFLIDRLRLDWAEVEGEFIYKRRPVTDNRVLEAMLKVPRHEFVPSWTRKWSYVDAPLSIGEGQTISQPWIVGQMTQALELKGNETVLEIGTGSGYQAAILAELAREVYTIEIIRSLAQRAADTLVTLGYKNVTVACGDGYRGWPEKAPFDAIIVTCAPDHIPQPLVEQLKVGGRMVLPVGPQYGEQHLVKLVKTQTGISKEVICPVRFVPMTGEAQRRKLKEDEDGSK